MSIMTTKDKIKNGTNKTKCYDKALSKRTNNRHG